MKIKYLNILFLKLQLAFQHSAMCYDVLME